MSCDDTSGDDLDVCDGTDNDCDAASPDGSDDPLFGAVCDGTDTDLCTEGTFDCIGGVLSCDDTSGDDIDVCDGTDNDCDAASADGSEDPQFGVACDGSDSDLCREGTFDCTAGAMSCDDTSADDLDVCDGTDNDCDAASADGSEDPQLGAACDGDDSDLCTEGTFDSCTGGALSCSDATGDDLDICDGADNDCDATSTDGSEDLQLGVACDGDDSDLCTEGTVDCTAGALRCSDATGDTMETCDGADNDCDERIDEGNVCVNFVPTLSSEAIVALILLTLASGLLAIRRLQAQL
jgi:hypothetical protein